MKASSCLKDFNREVKAIIEDVLVEPSDWARAKVLIAEKLVHRLLECYEDCIKRAFLLDLSGGEPVDTLEGGLDIDIFIESKNCNRSMFKEVEREADRVIRSALRSSRETDLLRKIKEYFGKGVDHNIIEIHVDSEFLRPLIEGKYSRHYRIRLYP